MLTIKKVLFCLKQEPNFWCVNFGNQKCLTSFELKDMISKKIVFSQKKALKRCENAFYLLPVAHFFPEVFNFLMYFLPFVYSLLPTVECFK